MGLARVLIPCCEQGPIPSSHRARAWSYLPKGLLLRSHLWLLCSQAGTAARQDPNFSNSLLTKGILPKQNKTNRSA